MLERDHEEGGRRRDRKREEEGAELEKGLREGRRGKRRREGGGEMGAKRERGEGGE